MTARILQSSETAGSVLTKQVTGKGFNKFFILLTNALMKSSVNVHETFRNTQRIM